MIRFGVKIICHSRPNIHPKRDENISTSSSPSILGEESICAYNILIVQQEDVDSYDNVGRFKKEELDEFFSKPSIIVCLSNKEVSYEGPLFLEGTSFKYRTATNYEWLPDVKGLEIVSKRGKGLKSTTDTGRFSNLFNLHSWEWKCSFSKLPSKYIPIASNLSNIPVALRADIGEGRVFIIPTPDINIYDYNKYATFLRQLIDVCEEEIEELGRRERKEPDWVEQHVDPLESKLLHDWFPYYERYNVLRGARKLLYETGLELTRIVHFVVSGIGFKAEMKEEEGIQDIEICEDDSDLVIEVTSSEENWINIYKTRQLSDWCERFESEKGKKPKGILIANPYCDYSPVERGEPFTLDALKHGESKGFCLMTTVQLYKIFCKFQKGEMSKDEIKQLFLETQGLLQFED